MQCGSCEGDLCKACALILEDGQFSYLAKVPEILSHAIYCGPCYDTHVAPELEIYNNLLERAKDVTVFFKTQGKETRLMKRSEKAFRVENCPDRDETLMRLAFLAAQGNFNTLIDVDLTSEKVRVGGYQNLKWQGTGIPTNAKSR